MIFVFTLVAFAVVFYLLMRWGCGGRLVHGLHLDDPGPEATDPVCGMRVADGEGYPLEHAGRIWRFCSRDCHQRFERHPETYLRPEGAPAHEESSP